MYVWIISSIRGPMCSWEMLNFAYLTSFEKNDIGSPWQPPPEKLLKFNMTFHDSSKKNVRSKHQNNSDSEVLRSDFQPLEHLQPQQPQRPQWPHQPHFIKKNYWAWCFHQPWHQNDILIWDGSSKSQYLIDLSIPQSLLVLTISLWHTLWHPMWGRTFGRRV